MIINGHKKGKHSYELTAAVVTVTWTVFAAVVCIAIAIS